MKENEQLGDTINNVMIFFIREIEDYGITINNIINQAQDLLPSSSGEGKVSLPRRRFENISNNVPFFDFLDEWSTELRNVNERVQMFINRITCKEVNFEQLCPPASVETDEDKAVIERIFSEPLRSIITQFKYDANITKISAHVLTSVLEPYLTKLEQASEENDKKSVLNYGSAQVLNKIFIELTGDVCCARRTISSYAYDFPDVEEIRNNH